MAVDPEQYKTTRLPQPRPLITTSEMLFRPSHYTMTKEITDENTGFKLLLGAKYEKSKRKVLPVIDIFLQIPPEELEHFRDRMEASFNHGKAEPEHEIAKPLPVNGVIFIANDVLDRREKTQEFGPQDAAHTRNLSAHLASLEVPASEPNGKPYQLSEKTQKEAIDFAKDCFEKLSLDLSVPVLTPRVR